MTIQTLTVGPFAENCYLFYENGKAIVIDPGDESDRILTFLKKNQLHLEKILLTHAHIDHIGAVDSLYESFHPEVFLHEEDHWLYQKVDEQANLFGLPISQMNELPLTFIKDQLRIPFSKEYFEVIHTPGHTQGSVCYHYPQEKLIFTGDTLFKGSIGRTDLPGGDLSKIISSIKQKLYSLNNDITIYPGHMDHSTIGKEKRMNPVVRDES